MPYVQGLPFASGSHTSYKAAVAVSTTRAQKSRRYLLHLLQGGQTDHEAHAATGIPLSTCARLEAR